MSEPVHSIFACRLLARPGVEPARKNATITLAKGLIQSVEYADRAKKSRGDSPDLLAMPALGNAHDHGRGLRYLSYGVRDAPLEAWVPAIYNRPEVDPYLNALLSMSRFAQAGIAAAVHCHQFPQQPEEFEEEIVTAARAADDVGIRLAMVVPMRDRNPLCYGADDTLLSLLSPEDRDDVTGIWRKPFVPTEEQVARIDRIAEQCESDLVQVLYGPIGVQWASDKLLEMVAEGSSRTGRRIHMHFLETKYQREWMDATYPDGIVNFLDQIGLLSPRLMVAHGVWLRPDEMEILAERGVSVSLNTSSNLRLGSGLAPARQMIAAGVSLALGIDGLALDDDDDALRELRLTQLLHKGPGFSNGIAPADLFGASMRGGPCAVTGKKNHGAISPGMAADILLVDYGAISENVVEGLLEEHELILARATTRCVNSLIVAGKKVVNNGEVLGVDLPKLEAEIAAQAASRADASPKRARILRSYQDALKKFYTANYHVVRPAKVPK